MALLSPVPGAVYGVLGETLVRVRTLRPPPIGGSITYRTFGEEKGGAEMKRDCQPRSNR
jgi:hypothetical protein